jgi:hypothetical protein
VLEIERLLYRASRWWNCECSRALVQVVAPGTGATVHTAARKLRTNVANWQFTLVETHDIPAGEGSADVVSSTLDRFLKGETARHTSGEHNRESTHTEPKPPCISR